MGGGSGKSLHFLASRRWKGRNLSGTWVAGGGRGCHPPSPPRLTPGFLPLDVRAAQGPEDILPVVLMLPSFLTHVKANWISITLFKREKRKVQHLLPVASLTHSKDLQTPLEQPRRAVLLPCAAVIVGSEPGNLRSHSERSPLPGRLSPL